MTQEEEFDMNGRGKVVQKEGPERQKAERWECPTRGWWGGPNTDLEQGPAHWGGQGGPAWEVQSLFAHQFPFSPSLLGRDWGSQSNTRQVCALLFLCSLHLYNAASRLCLEE